MMAEKSIVGSCARKIHRAPDKDMVLRPK